MFSCFHVFNRNILPSTRIYVAMFHTHTYLIKSINIFLLYSFTKNFLQNNDSNGIPVNFAPYVQSPVNEIVVKKLRQIVVQFELSMFRILNLVPINYF